MRRWTIALCALLLGGCSAHGHFAAGGTPHVLRIADRASPTSMDPLLAHDQDTIGYDLLVVQTLVGLDARNRLVPELAAEVPTRANGGISPDGRTIVYHLRHARFADGTPVTSADVLFTYHAILDPRNAVLSVDAYRRIASLTARGPHTVVIRLTRPWNAAVSTLFAQADFAFGILPAHAFASTDVEGASWENHAFGSGPFRVNIWRRGDRVVLVPNPYFRPKPRLRAIVLKMIPDESAGFFALRSGDVDTAILAPSMLASAREAGVPVLVTPLNGTMWFTLNVRRGPTAHRSVREAIAAAMNIPQLLKSEYDAFPPAGSVFPPQLLGADRAITPLRHDLARARRLLRGRAVSLTLITESGRPEYLQPATVLQAQLAQAGMRVTIKSVSTALYNAPDGPLRTGRFNIGEDAWIGGADPDQSIVFLCAQATQDGNNDSGYCRPRFDALAADESATRSERRRIADLRAMQEMIRQDLPVLPVYYDRNFDGVSPRVHGFARNMLEYPVDAQDWDVY